jgi:2,4-dienoyl-CoA reductase-like NADH-dependent reductase (Old Yellow Enzyme family)
MTEINLFSPLQIKGIILKNRIVVSPMCQYSAIDEFVDDQQFVHLGSQSIGSEGLIFTEIMAV